MRAASLLLGLAALLAALPAFLLAWAAGAPPSAAGLAAAGAFAAVALLAARPLRDLMALARQLEALAEAGEAPAPGFGRLFRRLGLARAARRLAERWRELRHDAGRRQSRAEAVLEALPDPVLLLDGRRRVARANRAARELLGEAAVGRELSELLRQPELHEAVAKVAAGAAEAGAEFRLAAPVERNFVCHAAAGALADGDEILLLLRDVTEIKRTAEMRSDFVANASHEIRTPLATIAGSVETLLGPARDDAEARQRFLLIVQQQAERMTRLVEDLLSLSRIELNEHLPPRGRVPLAELLRRVLDELSPLAETAGVRLELAPAAPPLAAVGERDQLAQVFRNLIDNAVKYGAAGGRVEVSLRPDPSGAAVAVRDWGPGIAPEHLPRLTERFYRVDKARSRALGGTGLGLAIVKHIVSRHRGSLEVESEPGRGSVFTVRLPAAPAVTKP